MVDDITQTAKKVFSKENLISAGKVLLGLGASEAINFGGDYAVRAMTGGKYKMPHEVGGLVTAAVAGFGFKDMTIVAAGLGDAGLNLVWDVVGFNVLDPVGSAQKIAGKTTDAAAASAPGTGLIIAA